MRGLIINELCGHPGHLRYLKYTMSLLIELILTYLVLAPDLDQDVQVEQSIDRLLATLACCHLEVLNEVFDLQTFARSLLWNGFCRIGSLIVVAVQLLLVVLLHDLLNVKHASIQQHWLVGLQPVVVLLRCISARWGRLWVILGVL